MARCPHCNYKFQLIDVKAECPVCGVNIPNYNWEERLDDDAANAEKSFAKFRKKTSAFKSSLFGNKFRIARFVLTFAPLLFLLFPMVSITANIPFSQGNESVSLLSAILAVVNGINIGSMISFTSFNLSGTAFIILYAALGVVLLGVVAAVLNFFVLIFSGFSYHAKGNIVCCIASIVFFVVAVILVILSGSMFRSSIPEVFTLNLSYGLFIGIALFAVNLVMNIVARKQFSNEKAAILKKEKEESAEKETQVA